MKKLLAVLVAVAFLIFAAVLLLPSLIDWNDYKDEIAARVTDATGRPVEIGGNISLSLLPSPAFSARQVTLRNIDGGSQPNMAEVSALQIRVELMPLLQGNVRVEQIALVEPQILLERLPDGRVNWNFEKAGDSTGDAGGSGGSDGGSLVGQVRLDSFRIIDGTIVYRDAASGLAEQITGLNAELTAESLSGPFRASGELAMRGTPASFQGSLGRFGNGGDTPYNVTLQLADTTAEASLAGAIAVNDNSGPSVRGSLRVRGEDLAATLAQIRGGAANVQPAQLAQRFRVASEITYEESHLTVEELSLQLGPTSADGRAEVAFADPIDASADLSIQRIDLDRLLAMQHAEAVSGGDGTTGESQQNQPAAFALPRGVNAELDLSVGAIAYRDQVIRQGRVNAVLADGLLTLNQAMALLPGSSDVALFGTLSGSEAGPRFDGRLEAASDNLRSVFDWLGVDVESVPSERLRRFNLLADVVGTPRQVTLTGMDIDVDTMQINGGVAMALRRRPGFGIGLTVDKLNLDAYLPQPSAGEAAAAADAQAATDGEGAQSVSLGLPSLDFLGGFDANLDLRAGELTYGSRIAQQVKLDATLHNQVLEVRELSVGNLAGASAHIDGSLRELVGLDPAFDLNVDLDVPDPRRLAQAFDAGDRVPVGVGAMALVGTLQGRPSEIALDGTLRAFDGTLTAEGTLQPLALPASFDLVLGLQHESLAGFLANLPGVPTLQRDQGPLELRGQVSGTTERFSTDRLKGTIGPVELTGPVGVDLRGERPMVTAQLETNTLPIEAFALATGPQGTSGSGGIGSGGQGGDGNRWSSEPIALDGLKAIDADLTLNAEAVAFDSDVRLEGARVVATLNNGLLDLEQASGELFGGPVSLNGTVDARETLALAGQLSAQNLGSGRLLRQGFDYGGVEGPVSFDTDLTAKGPSPRALIESLNGEGSLSGEITISPSAFLGPDAAQLLGGSGAAKAAQDLGALLGQALGERVQISGVTDALDFVGTSFADQPATLNGTFTAEQGVITTEDTRLDGQQGRARLTGAVDLPNWRLDATTRLFRAEDAEDDPYVVTRQVGPLDRPNVEITGGAFRDKLTPEPESEPEPEPAEPESEPAEESAPAAEEQAAPAPTEDSSGSEPAAQEEPAEPEPEPEEQADPEQPQRPSAEDIIRGVLENLKKQ